MRNSSPVALGQVIAGKYQVQGVLGEGGMGVVVSAWHLGLEQRVAIKLLLTHMRQSDSSALERFQREARAAARIQSEHVCRVLDTGHLEDGTPFLVMEYLEGADLSDELVRRGRFETLDAVRYVREACVALMHAHQAGVIHRDLKPANLFLVQRADGSRMIKVLDFGVSKSISSTGAPNLTLTKTSAMVGSPIYMSPEQLNSSKDVDGRTDIWALGIILYELIAGRTPFYGESIAQLVNAVLNTEPETMANLSIELPQGLEQVMRKALSKARDQRYASARELYNALGPFAGDRAGSISSVQSNRPMAPTRSMSLSDPPPRPTPSAPTPGAGVARPQSSRLRTALIALGLIALAGVAALLSRRGEREAPDPTAASMATPSVAAAPAAAPEPALPEPSLAAQPGSGSDTAQVAPSGADSNPAAASALSPDAAATPALANETTTPAAALTPHRPRDRARSDQGRAPTREPAQPAPATRPEPASSDPYLPNFGGRR
jgi:serine/threonine-protein kinase